MITARRGQARVLRCKACSIGARQVHPSQRTRQPTPGAAESGKEATYAVQQMAASAVRELPLARPPRTDQLCLAHSFDHLVGTANIS